MAPLEPSGRIDVYYIDTLEDQTGPGRDGWGLMASFDEESEALAFAEAQASKPQPGAGSIADRIVVICPGKGEIFRRQRPG